MRKLTQHKLNGLNDALEITVMDGPGAGGASHMYRIDFQHGEVDIDFQKGPILENGVNGISGEALIAILIDRLEGFQSGQFSNEDNAQALLHLQAALAALQKRTKERLARGVEGKSVV